VTSSADNAWYKTAFDSLYPILYPHRNRADALRAVRFLRNQIPTRQGGLVLDLCCGAGRHLVELSAAGLRAVGLDLSRPMLESAARDLETQGFDPMLVQGSMDRLPFRNAFDLAVNFFTSFGYFETDEENGAVLREVAQALQPGGRFIIDYMNAPWVRATLVPHSVEQTATKLQVDTRRSIEGQPPRVVKRIKVSGGRVERQIVESVRLFERSELTSMLEQAGLRVAGTWGDFDGRVYGEMAPRCILMAEKPA